MNVMRWLLREKTGHMTAAAGRAAGSAAPGAMGKRSTPGQWEREASMSADAPGDLMPEHAVRVPL